MRLSKIKLAGFKSFVDPTTIYLPSALIGVVGPNGCGKSNVIDAVRWVMGESSAKNLRGDSMADVVFNGSSSRKPVGSASVELYFDNSDGTVGGQYARYNEIAIKRVVSRDGVSNYYLNSARCRRKDITGLFLGTGLGARSYSIIEQGMISRLVEARPEELRVFLEEAAGISKYKERRRETENRIGHTRDNLSRLNDLRDEVEKLIKHLQHQARTAERYKKLKNEERRVTAELLALRMRTLQGRVDAGKLILLERDTALEAEVAGMRAVEAGVEKAREAHTDESERFNLVQGRYYQSGAEIARLEQSIQHRREIEARQQQDLQQAVQGLQELNLHIDRDESMLRDIDETLDALDPDLERKREVERTSQLALQEAEAQMQAWRRAWDIFNEESGDAQRRAHVEAARIEHLETQLARLEREQEKLRTGREALSADDPETELAGLTDRESHGRQQVSGLQSALEGMLSEIRSLREQDHELTRRLDECRSEQQAASGRMASLTALQQAALGQNESKATEWLARWQLDKSPRLAQQLDVEPGWEEAAETVLGGYLEAVCVDNLEAVLGDLSELDQGSLTLIDAVGIGAHSVDHARATLLAGKLRGAAGCSHLLAGVFAVDTLQDAAQMRGSLEPGQSVVTQSGAWVGPNWARVNSSADQRAGVIARESDLRKLREELAGMKGRLEQLEKVQLDTRMRLKQVEDARDARQRELGEAQREHAGLAARLDACRVRATQIREQIGVFDSDTTDVERDVSEAAGQLASARARLKEAQTHLARMDERRVGLVSQRDEIEERVSAARDHAHADREVAHEIAIKVESRRSSRESASVGLGRMQAQRVQFSERREALESQLADGEAPLREERRTLDTRLEHRVIIETALADTRKLVEGADERVRELEQQRVEHESRVAEVRARLDETRMEARELAVRREALDEQFATTGFDYSTVAAELPAEASLEGWDERLTKLARRVERLGPINLAAIDEFREQSARKEYLDRQLADLTEALTTLENAIRKIDRETRTRFKETFDKVNGGLKTMFPRLFGGGHAYLELTGDDLLSAGVTVMARPPGKRNSNIHLLSGGEKALTAVALVFAIFELNPAPFCLLDEVDAPLDDANVSRFCDLVREMSERVQFVFVTHNKTTMEMARQLTGVTMNEPGVSRLVAVDVDEAVQLAAM
ncbi:MAG: chromosome segregation protein SMC [Gammaproteobacteria bacterium]|nr:chromosome segregation protein SMC [Gammaproteobacteria bacterium]